MFIRRKEFNEVTRSINERIDRLAKDIISTEKSYWNYRENNSDEMARLNRRIMDLEQSKSKTSDSSRSASQEILFVAEEDRTYLCKARQSTSWDRLMVITILKVADRYYRIKVQEEDTGSSNSKSYWISKESFHKYYSVEEVLK